MKHVIELLHHHRFRFLIVVFVSLAVSMGAVLVAVESGNEKAKILTIEDGWWFSLTTMTGVGYGDLYPVTTLGRVLSGVLQIGGIVIFGLIVGYIAVSLFRIRDEFNWKRLFRRLDELQARINEMEKREGYLVKQVNDKKK